MLQTLNITVPVPDTHVIITKLEYEKLKDNQPMNMTLKEVAEYCQQTKGWIVKNIMLMKMEKENIYFIERK